jgi:hypothetical protein
LLITIDTIMANTPKRRQPGEKAEDIHRVWKEQAPDSVFGGKSLADFEAALAGLKQANEEVKIHNEARSAALRVRDQRLEALSPLMRWIVKGVQAHPEHGDNSPLYRAMGFVPFSERGSGLTRRTARDGGNATGQKETAA